MMCDPAVVRYDRAPSVNSWYFHPTGTSSQSVKNHSMTSSFLCSTTLRMPGLPYPTYKLKGRGPFGLVITLFVVTVRLAIRIGATGVSVVFRLGSERSELGRDQLFPERDID